MPLENNENNSYQEYLHYEFIATCVWPSTNPKNKDLC